MPKQEGQKSKLVTLLRILEQRTDENHRLNVPQLVQLLENQGILAERKSIYSDIDTLRSLGYDIQLQRGRGGGYWMASRAFELSELKLLVDAVQSSSVISARTSKRIIHKLEALCSDYEGTQLQRQVYVDGRPKADSRTLLYSIDALHTAISAGRLVQFRYKGSSAVRTVSPWQLAWENGCYYLIAYQDEKVPPVRHYRVDRMAGVLVLDEPRRGKEFFRTFDLPAYLRKHFNMFGGTEYRVTLRCAADLEPVMRERFGREPVFCPEDAEHFHFDVPICVSQQFFGWVCGFGGKVEVTPPSAPSCTRWCRALRSSMNKQKGFQKRLRAFLEPFFMMIFIPQIPDRWAKSGPARRQVLPQGGGSGGRWPFPVCCGQGGHCRRCGHRLPASGHSSPAGVRCRLRPGCSPCFWQGPG